ncbi:MAG: molybdopterin-dependent oxidoreductase [Sulfurovum sp.]|nr:molybdopterin-dependent oxidoreductase [Sulfurovum sp.]
MPKSKNPKIIVIDPRKSKTAQMADIFVPLKPRSDLALINGLCYIIFEQGWENEKFIAERTNGYSEFKKHILGNYPPQEVANITGIEVKELYNLAKIYASADAVMSAWTMGVNQSSIGTDTVSAICNLALITGNVGREGASPMSITGQCNAMGTREFGLLLHSLGIEIMHRNQTDKILLILLLYLKVSFLKKGVMPIHKLLMPLTVERLRLFGSWLPIHL